MRSDESPEAVRLRGGWPSRLGDILPGAMKKVGPAGLMAESQLRRAWAGVVGEQVAANVRVHRLRGTILEVSVPSDAWANEMRFLSEMIRERLNASCGPGTVTEVVVRRTRRTHRPGGAA